MLLDCYLFLLSFKLFSPVSEALAQAVVLATELVELVGCLVARLALYGGFILKAFDLRGVSF